MHEKELSDFLSRFKFTKSLAWHAGIEREHFLALPNGDLSPSAESFLKLIRDPRWTYELSACQVESRTRPQQDFSAIQLELLENTNRGQEIAQKLGMRIINQEVGSVNMPLDVYPDLRYLEIARVIPREKLEAACRVTGTHIHLGVRNMAHAILVYNSLISRLDMLCRIGDHSNGERLKLYKTMAVNWQPMFYENETHFFEIAQRNGFADNPRNCWQLIRISAHGTVELRMFGVTDHADEILWWISEIKRITRGAW